MWRGRIYTTNGSFRDLNLLGMDADEPGSILLTDKQIVIAQRRERSYDGFEFSVSGPSTSILHVELRTVGEVKKRVFKIPIQDLVTNYRSESLDRDNNRLVIRRAPGDYIRLAFQRDHLVFSPGETFLLNILPHELKVSPGANVRCTVKLRKGRRRAEVWDTSQVFRSDAIGAIPPWNQCLIPIPEEEGVYDLVVALTNRRLAAPFAGDKPIAKRKLQLVVIDKEAKVNDEAGSIRLLADLDPTQKNWWQRMMKLPQWSLLPGLRSDGPLGNKETERWSHEGRVWTRLPGGGWQAYPLPIDAVGVEHELEVDFPGGLPQGFVVSIVEPNAAGKVIPVGLDSGTIVTRDDVNGVGVKLPKVAAHRLTFWPRTKSPLVLVTNLSEDTPAVFGRFRIYRRESQPKAPPVRPDGRRAFAYFEKPLFPECFSATESLDTETGRSLEDWKTFYDGATRLIQYVKRVGYNGLVITCASEGSTLYPSQILQPTPKHDRGIFFATGQDAVRKDVLEMLFRLCDREGITLVPAIEFATPLPGLEQLRWRRDQSAAGIDLLDSSGMTWVERYNGAKRGRAPYYNPLNQRVQDEMVAAVRELATRYANHSSFGGISITLTPDGFTQLPDYEWALDAQTIKRFTEEKGVQGNGTSSIRNLLLYGKSRAQWLEWRSRKLAGLYERMGEALARQQPNARLYLAGARLIESRPIQRVFRPALPREANIESAMKDLGLDIKHYQDNEQIVFLRPHKIRQTVAASRRGADIEFNLGDEVDHYFDSTASQFLLEPYRKRLASFDDLSPFGRGTTVMSLVAQVSPVAFQNRERFIHAISVRDVDVIFEGGWLLPLGQEQELRDLLQTFGQLPAVPFEDALPEKPIQPVQIRQLTKDDRTYVYLVNDSPWPLNSVVRFDVGPGVRFESVSDRPLEEIEYEQTKATWNLELRPYDFVAIQAAGVARVNSAELRVPPEVRLALQNRINNLSRRAAQLNNPPSLDLLSNSGFEEPPGPGGKIPGWSTEWMSGIDLEQEDVFEGKSALRVRSASAARVLLSEPIVPPKSGRLSIAIRAKAVDPKRPPQARLVLKANNTTYYPWAAIGAEKSESKLDGAWKEFVFRVNHLPPIGSNLQVGIEVSGRGEVLFDDLRIYDILALDDSEHRVLLRKLYLADFQLRESHLSDCLHSLSGYWPRYLMNNVPEARGLVGPPQPARQKRDDEPATASRLDRILKLVPKIRR